MDILITNNGEVAAISETITAIDGGYQLADGAVYPAGLTRLSGVTIPANLAGKRLSYIDAVFAELPEHPRAVSVPQSVDPLRAIYLLDQMGFGAAYTAWRDAPARTLIERETLLRAQVWERSNPTLIAAATAMGITSDQLDQMFIQIGNGGG